MGLADESTEALKMKAMILRKVIEDAKTDGDDRWKNVTEDLETLDNEIKKREKPPPTRIQLKPAEVTARAPSPNEGKSNG